MIMVVGLIKNIPSQKVIKMNFFDAIMTMKILVVDDDEWIRDSLSLFFKNEGCDLLALETAEEAIEILAVQSFGIILVDYSLPGMNGLEFLNRIRKSCPDTIKILITAYGADDVISKARDLGVVDVINKPFTGDIIENALSRLLVKHAQCEIPADAAAGMDKDE